MQGRNVTALRSIELGVTDLERAAHFYKAVWGLEPVGSWHGMYYFRAGNTEHHAVCIRETPQAALLGITLAAPDTAAVDRVYARALSASVKTTAAPAQLPAAGGGGYGVTLQSPEGLLVTISCDVAPVPEYPMDSTKPHNLTHVVINSADVATQMAFFIDVLGLRLSDTTDRMVFLRCGADHHTIALAHGDGLSLNHAAFEMHDIDGLMYGAGRLSAHGHDIEWGLGRHGPGNNVFAYFIDPDGFVVEYTTEMQQVDENTYQPCDAQYWASFPNRPCRWGVARKPSERLMAAMAGKNLAGAT